MFWGEYSHSIDEKGRLTIPAKYRDRLGEAIITRGLDHNLALYPLPAWEQLVARLRQLPMTDPNARALQRLIFSGAQEVAPDKQGRILVPPYLREYAGVTQNAVIAGMESYVEIWSPDAWAETLEMVQNTEANAANWQALGI
ncbi:MAG: division/cell wall cluster transcriptional repressor MraZ [Anaerolineae bacterium]|nr:division/cell wall cluster transcriptional repressor MraZ [Anaerolineae bacterium]